jgi:site-specific recombinase
MLSHKEIKKVLAQLAASDDLPDNTDVLNELLLNPNHRSHQRIVKRLQGIADPSTVPFVRKALESNFDYLAYTCSDDAVIAKWFSWLLYAIATDDAIALMIAYSTSDNEEINKEMRYRLQKIV